MLTHIFFTGTSDFDPKLESFVFGGSSQHTKQCCNISTVDDVFVENNELFFIRLNVEDMLVNIPISTAQVTIQDNDGI